MELAPRSTSSLVLMMTSSKKNGAREWRIIRVKFKESQNLKSIEEERLLNGVGGHFSERDIVGEIIGRPSPTLINSVFFP